MIATIGDLVDDIVVHLHASVARATDTPASIRRRRGGSAANVAAAVARLGYPARFIGQVGADAAGAWLVAELEATGVHVVVRRRGTTGTIVVILDHAGERTMLTDRGSSGELDAPDRRWLQGVQVLHVPLYSLIGGTLANTAARLVSWAHAAGVMVAVDASSSSLIESAGATRARAAIAACRPHVLFCNEPEHAALGGDAHRDDLGAAVVVVKYGPAPAIVLRASGERVSVPVPLVADVRDTTGAGDAFAAGFLAATCSGSNDIDAVVAGHRSAAAAIVTASRAT